MVSAIILGLVLRGGQAALHASRGGEMWEETVSVQQEPGYHPIIRFSCWEITRFIKSTTYMFMTPDLIQQGQYQARDGHYFFRAVMANELEVADKNNLLADMDPRARRGTEDSYAKSMLNFEGDFDNRRNALYITYLVKGAPRRFELHLSTEGDDQLSSAVSDTERGLVGVWHAPDPFPDKLDARTRTKIDEFGLHHFVKEASACESAIFTQLDLRVDKSFRSHGNVGTWSRDGSSIVLISKGSPMRLEISRDGNFLSVKGKQVYVRY